jgi:pantoate--beta-alanine ligase
MKKATSAADAAGIIAEAKRKGLSIGLVPTMGALHEGHLSLVRMSRESSDFTAVSLFVNPKQFGPSEDLDKYPRKEDQDEKLLEELGVDLLFMPEKDSLYSDSDSTRISMNNLGDHLCGASRPGHFDGVLLIVAKLFNIISPDHAWFGQKDAQQAVIIQRMAADLDFKVRIYLGPTIREPDGLAMSSRNSYLSEEERKRAPAIRKGLLRAAEALEKGERDPKKLTNTVKTLMTNSGFEIDYVELVDGATLQPAERAEGTILLAAAGRLGATRLIDNIAMEVTPDKARETLLEFPEWSRFNE